MASVIENRDVAAAESIMKDYEEHRSNTQAWYDYLITWKKMHFFQGSMRDTAINNTETRFNFRLKPGKD